MKEIFNLGLTGHILIKEYSTLDDLANKINGKIVLNKRNAIHPEHATIMMARGAADRPNGSIYSMSFGTGGATVDPLGNIVYAIPNTEGAADLNTPVYSAIVDDNAGAPSGNNMTVLHINGTIVSNVEIRCVLDTTLPAGQPTYDNLTGTNLNNSQFVFNELGLKTADGLLVTHAVFAPVVKSGNRVMEVLYTLVFTIQTS